MATTVIRDLYDVATTIATHEGPDGKAARRSLFVAIVERPHEDTPRMVYADCLDQFADNAPSVDPDDTDEERREYADLGQLMRRHAEFIRLQLKIQRGGTCGKCQGTGREKGAGLGTTCNCGIASDLAMVHELATQPMPQSVYDLGHSSTLRDFATDPLNRRLWQTRTTDPHAIIQGGFVSAFNCGKHFWLSHGPTLVRRLPIVGIHLLDAIPIRGGFGWQVMSDRNFRHYQRSNNAREAFTATIPQSWYDLLNGNTDAAKQARKDCTVPLTRSGQRHNDAYRQNGAMLELDRLALWWARHEAGLPDIAPYDLEGGALEHTLRARLLAQPLRTANS